MIVEEKKKGEINSNKEEEEINRGRSYEMMSVLRDRKEWNSRISEKKRIGKGLWGK